ncbi:MAG TPA: ABC transporter permease [Candidatus Acidoferrum sp.]|nr:ABC transporter permease [Candidatus Acidoferrum sp.]
MHWLARLFHKESSEQQLDSELRFHLEKQISAHVANGLSPAEARRRANLDLGGLEQTKELSRSSRRGYFLEAFFQDTRYSLRLLRKSPGFSLVAILTLALGIGANTAIFSVIDSVLLRPFPFKNPAQLVSLRETESAPGDFPLDGADYLDWQAQNKTFSSMSLYSYPEARNASGAGQPEVISVRQTQANFFDTLGVSPLIGRTFATGEDVAGKNRIVVLSYGFWKSHYAADRAAPGKTIQLDDEPYVIIGVMPPWFNFPPATDLWTPMNMNGQQIHNRGSHWANALGRVKEGVTIAQARADLLDISANINKQYRAANDQDIHSLVFPLKDYLVGGSQSELLILFGAVALVLLVACANIANLLLARSTGRIREMAVRSAMGAGRWRLARQLLTESVLLAFAGAVLGVFGAWWGVSALNAARTSPIPRINAVSVNLTVLLFTVGISLLVGILFGLAPALQSSDLNLSDELKSSAKSVSGGRGGQLLRNSLIVAEIAVCLALLVGAGLLLRSFAGLRSAHIGVDPRGVLTMRLNLPAAQYKNAPTQMSFFNQLIERLERLPGTQSASVSTEMALEGGSNGYVTVPGVTNPKLATVLIEDNWITTDYFRTFGIPLLQGRNFTEDDMRHSLDVGDKMLSIYQSAKDPSKVTFPPDLSYPVVINNSMAKLFWPNQDPLGKFYTQEGGGPREIVIGVVGDETQQNIRSGPAPENYVPLPILLGFPGFAGTVSLKTKMALESALNEVRRAVLGLDSTIGVYRVRTLDDAIAENIQDTTLQTFLLGVFAALALVLASLGLYGVMSYLVTQRTREIGIRMALGAQHAGVLRMVIFQGGKLVLLGILIGVAGALGLTQLLSASLFGVSATDPLTYMAVAALLAIVALLACYLPARRASRVDPLVALRYE